MEVKGGTITIKVKEYNMSRMGNYNLQLQEQAEELGFSTTQEALDNGYHVVEDMVTGEATLKKLDEQEQAHEAWLKEKEEALGKINHLLGAIEYLYGGEDFNPDTAAVALDGNINMPFRYADALAIKKFIEGVSHE